MIKIDNLPNEQYWQVKGAISKGLIKHGKDKDGDIVIDLNSLISDKPQKPVYKKGANLTHHLEAEKAYPNTLAQWQAKKDAIDQANAQNAND